MNAFLKLTAFDLRLYLRDWITIFWVLVYPVLMLLLFGSMFGDSPSTIYPGGRYIDDYVPALCAMNVMSVSLFTLNINMITYRQNGILRRFRVTPIRKPAVLASHTVQGILLIVAGAVEIVILAKLIWDVQLTAASLAAVIGSLLMGVIGFFSLGFALSGLVSTTGAASGLAMIVFFPMIFLSGIAMPLAMLPDVMQSISRWIPMTYYVDLVRGAWYGQPFTELGKELLVMAGFTITCCILALLLFRWENR